MEIFRVSKNAYGQETLIGVSWDITWWFIAASVAFVVVHILYKWLLAPDVDGDRVAADGDTTVSKT